MLSKCLGSEIRWLSRAVVQKSWHASQECRRGACSQEQVQYRSRTAKYIQPSESSSLHNPGASSLDSKWVRKTPGEVHSIGWSSLSRSSRAYQDRAADRNGTTTHLAATSQPNNASCAESSSSTDGVLESRSEAEGSGPATSESDINSGRTPHRPYFPYGDQFKIGDQILSPGQIIDMLGVFMDDKRKERMAQVVAGRTYGIVPVVEGLFDLGNVAAVCRSAEALGCQNVHLIERGDKKYRSSQRITAGADKWLDFETWDSTAQCFAALRERGYRIAVTYCDGGSVSTPIEDMDWSIPTAVVLGNEHAGVSAEAIADADIQCSIPMDGFVDSFNISVAAAIIMHYAKRQRGRTGDLTPEQQQILVAEFYLRNNRSTEDVLQHLLAKSTVVQQPSFQSKL